MLCQLLVSLLLLVPSTSLIEDKIDAKLLLGKWEPEKKPDGVDKLVVEYKKDDKISVEVETQGMKLNFEGTYKVEGDKLSIKIDINGNEQNQKRKITKLTADEMVTTDEESKEERKYKKVK